LDEDKINFLEHPFDICMLKKSVPEPTSVIESLIAVVIMLKTLQGVLF